MSDGALKSSNHEKNGYIFFNSVWDNLLQDAYEDDAQALKAAEELSKTQGLVKIFRFVGAVGSDDADGL